MFLKQLARLSIGKNGETGKLVMGLPHINQKLVIPQFST
jgi:hypothetical protein